MRDIPALVHGMLTLKEQTGWAQVQGAYTQETLAQFLGARLSDPTSICYVWEGESGGITAFCGCACNRFYLPPYMPLLFEWGWAGSSREAVQCWQACCEWGRKRGIEWAGRVKAQPGTSSQRVVEQQIWNKL